MAGKKKKKGRNGGGSAASSGSAWRGVAVLGAVLMAGAAGSFFLREEWNWLSPQFVAACYVVGLLTGFSGNALLIIPLASVAAGLAGIKALNLNLPPFLEYEAGSLAGHMALLSISGGLVTLFGAYRNRMLRYEPVFVVPCLGLAGLAAAFWARHASPLFNDVMISTFDGGGFLGLVLVSVLLLLIYEWKNGVGADYRSWIFGAVGGPFIGFWVGYADTNWPFLLMILLILLETVVLRERPAAVVAGLPLMAAPLWAARMFHPGAGGVLETTGRLFGEGGWQFTVVSLLFFSAAHLFAYKVLETSQYRRGRTVFFTLTMLFMLYLLASLVVGYPGSAPV